MIYIDTAFKLIIARYYTPSSRCIQAIGYQQIIKIYVYIFICIYYVYVYIYIIDIMSAPLVLYLLYLYIYVHTHTHTHPRTGRCIQAIDYKQSTA